MHLFSLSDHGYDTLILVIMFRVVNVLRRADIFKSIGKQGVHDPIHS